ncbi:site-specific integrase [Pontimicrobium sp. SW4]|uniref:Site-specific integrase n=1 Tax=Pontimicrobium sp. SW4 TaxID=3153519 RepID=A0AAU7BS91_9FLAO
MSRLPILTLSKVIHRKQNQILISFKHNWSLINVVKHLPNAKWSTTLKSWYIKNNSENLKQIYSIFKGHAYIDNRLLFDKKTDIKAKFPNKRKRHLTQQNKDILNNFYRYLIGKRYSKSTVLTYSFFIADFIEFHNNKALKHLTVKDVEMFIEMVFIKRKYSISTQRQFISAVKQFIVFYPKTGISDLALTRPTKSKLLPTVLSQEEMITIIQCTKNLKHRAILALIYSTGLRIGELLHLKLANIQIHRKQLFIHQAKGRKDRYVTLADSFMPLLQNYLMTYKPKVYFVEGAIGKPYSASSVRKFLSRSCKAANIDRRITPHTLRHSYATHLLESGVGLRHIQELLGHVKPETTMIYTHVARKDLLDIKSPLDYAIEQVTKTNKVEQKFLLSRE